MKIWIMILLLASPVFGQDVMSAVYHDNVVMVVDGSGSMNDRWSGTDDRKMDIAKVAMKTVLATVNENTQIGIVVFSGGRTTWIYPLGPKNDAALTEAIDNIGCGGGTPLGTNIKTGADALIEQRQKQFGYGSYRLLIVTDGQASGWGEEDKMKEYTPLVIARGINVDVIGVDMGGEHALAKIVGDNYRAADNPASLTKAIKEVFAEVDRKDADDSAKDFELLEGLDPALAKEMIGALAKPQNHPIGTNPPAPQLQRSDASPSSSASPAANYGDPVNVDTGNRSPWIFGGVVAFVVLAIVVGKGITRNHF